MNRKQSATSIIFFRWVPPIGGHVVELEVYAHVREHALRSHVCVGGLRRVRMSKAGGVSNVELSTNLEKTCRMMSYHAVVRISYLVGRGSFRQKWMGGATAVHLIAR